MYQHFFSTQTGYKIKNFKKNRLDFITIHYTFSFGKEEHLNDTYFL